MDEIMYIIYKYAPMNGACNEIINKDIKEFEKYNEFCKKQIEDGYIPYNSRFSNDILFNYSKYRLRFNKLNVRF